MCVRASGYTGICKDLLNSVRSAFNSWNSSTPPMRRTIMYVALAPIAPRSSLRSKQANLNTIFTVGWSTCVFAKKMCWVSPIPVCNRNMYYNWAWQSQIRSNLESCHQIVTWQTVQVVFVGDKYRKVSSGYPTWLTNPKDSERIESISYHPQKSSLHVCILSSLHSLP